MAKLQNISGLLVAINSDYTKDVVVTTKTTRAELTSMLQATESALVEVLLRMEGYASKVEELEKDKQNLSNKVGKLNREVIELKDSIINLEERKEKLEAENSALATELELENTRCKRAKHKVETMQATIDKLMNRSFFERLLNKQ